MWSRFTVVGGAVDYELVLTSAVLVQPGGFIGYFNDEYYAMAKEESISSKDY